MDDAIGLWACVECHCLAARRTARAITRLYEARLRPHGLRATQFSILAALALKGPTPVTELAELLGLERTTLTRGVAPLERNGWVGSGRSEDARERVLRLTPDGRRKLESAFPAWKEVLDALEARYPVLRGTTRDHVTHHRRPLVRFFACKQDLSNESPDAPLPEAVATGAEPFLIVGAMAGG